MQILPSDLDKQLLHNLGTLQQAPFLDDDAHLVVDLLHVFGLHQIGHFARVQDIVNVFQEALVEYVVIRQVDIGRGVLGASLLQQLAQILLPTLFVVVLRDLESVTGKCTDERAKLG